MAAKRSPRSPCTIALTPRREIDCRFMSRASCLMPARWFSPSSMGRSPPARACASTEPATAGFTRLALTRHKPENRRKSGCEYEYERPHRSLVPALSRSRASARLRRALRLARILSGRDGEGVPPHLADGGARRGTAEAGRLEGQAARLRQHLGHPHARQGRRGAWLPQHLLAPGQQGGGGTGRRDLRRRQGGGDLMPVSWLGLRRRRCAQAGA